MKKNYFSNSLQPIFVLFLLLSCSDSYEQNEEDITPTPAPQTNTLYTSMQWETSSPAEEGMDPDLLETAFINGFSDGSFTQAALVIRNEKIVLEQYRGITEGEIQILSDYGVIDEIKQKYDYRDQYDLASSWSTAKSFISILVGIAIDRGYIESIEESASNYIYEW